MEISTDEKGNLIVSRFYNSIILQQGNEELAVCCRDSGFEFKFGEKFYEAKNGELREMRSDKYFQTEDNELPTCNNK